jgi:hypothetical protein
MMTWLLSIGTTISETSYVHPSKFSPKFFQYQETFVLWDTHEQRAYDSSSAKLSWPRIYPCESTKKLNQRRINEKTIHTHPLTSSKALE